MKVIIVFSLRLAGPPSVEPSMKGDIPSALMLTPPSTLRPLMPKLRIGSFLAKSKPAPAVPCAFVSPKMPIILKVGLKLPSVFSGIAMSASAPDTSLFLSVSVRRTVTTTLGLTTSPNSRRRPIEATVSLLLEKVVTGVPILTPAKLAVEVIEKIVKAKILAK